MKIKHIHIKEFGPYQDWDFSFPDKGIVFFYGPNESGKTSLLELIRSLLFGWKNRRYPTLEAHLQLEREGKRYQLGRRGKRLEFFPLGESNIGTEPAQLWWHGLDKKTYDRIFALTLADLQGADILGEVEVRTRFFGATDGERLSSAVKEIEKTAADLLVASANGKRKINVLLEKLKQNKEQTALYSENETAYRQLQERLDGTAITEKELKERLAQWQEYLESVDLVLRAWDTYKRAEEAKGKLNTLADTKLLEREAFLELDREISQCREHMRIWKGKEEGLLPENFAPDAPIGIYAQEIESLYQQLSKWEQLKKECEQGQTYLRSYEEQLRFARKMHTAWRSETEMPKEVDWYQGEQLAARLRSAREAVQQWQYREPICPVELTTHLLQAEDSTVYSKAEAAWEATRDAFGEKKRLLQELERMQQTPLPTKWWTWGAIALGVCAVLVYAVLGNVPGRSLYTALVALGGLASYVWGHWQADTHGKRLDGKRREVRDAEEKLERIDSEYGSGIPYTDDDLARMKADFESLRKSYHSHDVEQAKLHAYEQQRKQWEEEGERLHTAGEAALQAWKDWLPQGAGLTLSDTDFFGLKQEYDQYMEQAKQFEENQKRLQERQEELQLIEDAAKEVWQHLELETEPSITELRRLYNALKAFRQNKTRWEQKETQRKSFREEYDQWNRKEKELLLQQSELLQRSGIGTAGEYRQKLLAQEQLQQWDTIYKQSQVQLNLLAPRKETYDLLCRRLKEGNKAKWVEEHNRGQQEVEGLQQQLAILYEQRGELAEHMRSLSVSRDMAQVIQEKARLETELAEALEDWATQVIISHCLEEAQQVYEREKQPQVLEMASTYVQSLTKGRYTLSGGTEGTELYAVGREGTRLAATQWSSGLADQIYLALRLSLAKSFSNRVEGLPIVLDDILLRFDEDRQEQALALLAELGETEQIMIFSCQQSLYRLAQAQTGIHTFTLGEQS